MTTSQYASLIPVELTADDVFRNLPPEEKIGWLPAPSQIVRLGEKILMYRDPANDNKKPEEKDAQPDPAETALRKFEEHLNPSLEKLVAQNHKFVQRPNRTAQKTFHAPQPETKSVPSKPLEEIMHFYQEQSPEYQDQVTEDIMACKKRRSDKKDFGLLKLVHTVIDSAIEETPLPKNRSSSVKTVILIAELVAAA